MATQSAIGNSKEIITVRKPSTLRKNLVVVRAGDASEHHALRPYTKYREWDLMVSSFSQNQQTIDTETADWVITGEGAFDEQSLRGKVVAGVAALARQHGVKIAVLAGRVLLTEVQWRAAGVDQAQAIAPATMSTPDAMRQASALLRAAAQQLPLT